MKSATLSIAFALAAATLPAVSHADLAFNVGAVSEYRYRGISQTRFRPAVQGGVDFTQGGLYLGAWASTIRWIKDAGGDASIELDLYGGYKGEIAKDFGYDVGVLRYEYPGNKLDPSANTTEVYGALTYGPGTLKVSKSVSDTFGAIDSKSSYYVDLSATYEVGGIALTPHVGYQRIGGPSSGIASYTDYALTASKDFSGIVLSLSVVGTDADKAFYTSPANGKNLGRTGVVLGVKANF